MKCRILRSSAPTRPGLLRASVCAAALMAFVLSGASAQFDSPAEEEAARQQTITVTGSRIPADPNLVSSVPVQSLNEEAFRISGEISVSDIVNDVPALVSSTSAENSATGASALNLRGLGEERTLTLINGRRSVGGFEGSQAVDISTVPAALIQRV